MSNLGFGVMINMLRGNADSVASYQASLNKTILNIELTADDALQIGFTDGSVLRIFDDGQSCCESRYMKTDDDLQSFVGDQFLGAEIKDAPNMPDEWGDHEVQFLEVKTNKGVFTMASHNEHNGYYGGFSICCQLIAGVQP